MKPETKYAKSGDINIAYQVIGHGPIDLIFVHGWISNIDMLWVDQKLSDFLNYLTSFTRLILFDKRGTGLSDKVRATCTLEERMDDIRCVMDATHSRKAVLFGHSEGGTVCGLFAATYPERTISLMLFGVFAKRKYSEDYPWAPKPEEREQFYKLIIEGWGNGRKIGLESLMPSMVNDKKYYDWFASYLRSAASPGTALALAKMNYEADITHVLSDIVTPTLIFHRKHDRDVNVEEGKYLARHIRNSKFVELPGEDHLFWIGEVNLVLAEMKEFVTGVRPELEKVKLGRPKISNTGIDIDSTMLNNFKFNLCIEDFAKLCGRSLSMFKRDFQKKYETTPYKWLKTKRLEYAKSLLIDSDLNINQICYESGFVNVSHFIQSFKEKYGLSPKQYRSSVFSEII